MSAVGVSVKVGVIGDYRPELPSHEATDRALQDAAAHAGGGVEVVWLGTEAIAAGGDEPLRACDAFLCAPGSPYRSVRGALRALRFARAERRPLLGTCGGFQHMVIEFARHVLGRQDAVSPESDPSAPQTFLKPVACAMFGREFDVAIDPSSRACALYRALRVRETYRCSFEIDPARQSELHAAGLRVTGIDDDGRARIVELADHPFYIGTLFVPQMRPSPAPHPLVLGLVDAARAHGRTPTAPESRAVDSALATRGPAARD